VVPEPGEPAVGTIGVWDSEVDGEAVSEAGWMILPEHQGKGFASAALRLVLQMARSNPRWGDIHACPGASNGASNALCRKSGFVLLGPLTVDYAGRTLEVNHWVWRAP
jgi:RimJ/RimL family protein N-acetyltransferase